LVSFQAYVRLVTDAMVPVSRSRAPLVFAEKVVPHGRGVGLAAAAVLVGYGVAVITQPQLLPTVTS
jgi:hypothetical protein